MKLIYSLIFLLTLSFTFPAYAETTTDFSDEGLSDADLTTDLAAEALPTTNAASFWWENVRDNVISVFTFNVEKKAAQMRLRLHRLDRKLAACAEIGDQECIAKVEERSQALEQRTEQYIAKRQELKDKFQDRFIQWRESRDAKASELQQQAAARRDQRQQLTQQRQANRQQAIQNRQQNREQLIEMRSQNLKDRLDAAREGAASHQQKLRDLETDDTN